MFKFIVDIGNSNLTKKLSAFSFNRISQCWTDGLFSVGSMLAWQQQSSEDVWQIYLFTKIDATAMTLLTYRHTLCVYEGIKGTYTRGRIKSRACSYKLPLLNNVNRIYNIVDVEMTTEKTAALSGLLVRQLYEFQPLSVFQNGFCPHFLAPLFVHRS